MKKKSGRTVKGSVGAENNSRRYRDKTELIGGRQTVLEALRYGSPRRILLVEGQRGRVIEEITTLANKKRIQCEFLPRNDFARLTHEITSPQGVAALVPSFYYHTLDELIKISRSAARQPFLLMLDHIEDPQNLGAVMRTADAAGVHGLIIPDKRAAGVTAAVRKVAAGAAERLPVALVGNLNRATEQLKEEGFWVYGAEAAGELEYYRADYRRALVLLVGSEGKGISRLLRENCDQMLTIPMPGKAGSLNLSVAAALIIYTVLAQREGWSS
ncbi:MAG: 23S rRNA (guanosine(2251)-2'-O)-methyltransferase RlmB [Bacillota bacterium]|nr:23S rRNA (guanosine(2251)-2'-O)-methyltransferase RlmB [Bacillota bacterium]